ncbi:heavy metal translocating P-type ATPase [Rhodovastum atsumiense]|uniref:Cadmium-translocating P-type ATPase n=1 Tax=Rhodovastum atsumiense TaxID=504468 RepID=A0A5M6J2D6_9PROT|nr:heavy metal translocating P-type ATPase metal-binding domain-containing protein [Rhodovastum atsumiense]KAA5614752.1 cadmium-translocating P-type ATPase [Rhodovastum atsumiense]
MSATVAAVDSPAPATTADAACVHCGQAVPSGRRFCCPGCAAAFETIQGLGLGRYYQQRVLDPAGRAPRPEAGERWDLARHIVTEPDGGHTLTLAVDGLQCGACVWLIESVLARQPGLRQGRVNMTTRRLRLAWQGAPEQAERFVAAVEKLGYRLVPFNMAYLAAADDRTGRMLIRALGVAAFASLNVMTNSLAVWSGFDEGMGPATRSLLYWVSALIAMPAVLYAGMPFFRSAFAALRAGRTNMDVPISLGVLLVTALSLSETLRGGLHTYFDSAVSLLFFLLIGRVLDHRARGQARATAEQLLALRATDVAVLAGDGSIVRRAQESIAPGERVLVGMGERIGVDGVIAEGSAPLDASLVTGESLPVAASPGTAVFAGTLNLGGRLVVRATATGQATLLAECVRLIEAAEARRGRFVVLADRVARLYTPVVHLCAAATFLGWWLLGGMAAAEALLIACAVLIITCPCALALAVPAVQVIATGTLFRAGMLLKSATALERLARVDTVVFDKTGTLTEPVLALTEDPTRDPAALREAASLAAVSRHPLARSLLAAAGSVPAAAAVEEIPGEGLRASTPDGDIRLGSRSFAGDPAAPPGDGPELWLARPGQAPVAFRFHEQLRPDAAETIAWLHRAGLTVRLASGDRAGAVARVAEALGIAQWRAEVTPVDKVALVEALRAEGRHVLMVGDGLNDGPSLAAASVSMSPSTAADISQTVADVVFQGHHLAPVVTVLRTARRARAGMQENLGLSLVYNVFMLPLAATGFVTPWLAAVAMSSSSLLVMANSFRVRVKGGAT